MGLEVVGRLEGVSCLSVTCVAVKPGMFGNACAGAGAARGARTSHLSLTCGTQIMTCLNYYSARTCAAYHVHEHD